MSNFIGGFAQNNAALPQLFSCIHLPDSQCRRMPPDDPPPKVYGFKERDFKRDNSLSAPATPNPTVKELAVMAGKVTRQTAGKSGPRADDPNDVHTVLQQNRAAEKQTGRDQVDLLQTKSRRRRDYWLLLLSSEALLGVVAFQGRDNPALFVAGLSGMVLVAVGLTWIMWQVMGRY